MQHTSVCGVRNRKSGGWSAVSRFVSLSPLTGPEWRRVYMFDDEPRGVRGGRGAQRGESEVDKLQLGIMS